MASKPVEMWMPAIVAAITVAVPGYLSYKSNKDESASGYKVLVQSVQELQRAVEAQDKRIDELAKENAEMKGELKAWAEVNKARMARPVTTLGIGSIGVTGTGSGGGGSSFVKAEEPVVAKQPRFKRLPESISKANEQIQQTAK